jgi:hypothetical protein
MYQLIISYWLKSEKSDSFNLSLVKNQFTEFLLKKNIGREVKSNKPGGQNFDLKELDSPKLRPPHA